MIQAVANRGKDMSAERVDQTLIILMIAQSRTRDTQVEIGMATVEVDMVLRRRLDVSICSNIGFSLNIHHHDCLAGECWFCLSNPSLAYISLSLLIASH